MEAKTNTKHKAKQTSEMKDQNGIAATTHVSYKVLLNIPQLNWQGQELDRKYYHSLYHEANLANQASSQVVRHVCLL